MNFRKVNILVITPIKHINGVLSALKDFGNVTIIEEPSYNQVFQVINEFDAIFTNPNKSNVFISEDLMKQGTNLKAICTASTGTNHIDIESAKKLKIKVLSLTEKRRIINKISSTAEHAFALMMSSIRNINTGWESVKSGKWNYLPFIGRQINHLTIGIIGYGRLGKLFARYSRSFGADIMIYDPYKEVKNKNYKQVSSSTLLKDSDVISLHVHVTNETTKMINKNWLNKMKSDVLIINTSRGEIINENDMINFLENNPYSKYATDVISNEVKNKKESPFKNWCIKNPEQVLITPHIGGMTREAQEIAYNHAAKMLGEFSAKNK